MMLDTRLNTAHLFCFIVYIAMTLLLSSEAYSNTLPTYRTSCAHSAIDEVDILFSADCSTAYVLAPKRIKAKLVSVKIQNELDCSVQNAFSAASKQICQTNSDKIPSSTSVLNEHLTILEQTEGSCASTPQQKSFLDIRRSYAENHQGKALMRLESDWLELMERFEALNPNFLVKPIPIEHLSLAFQNHAEAQTEINFDGTTIDGLLFSLPLSAEELCHPNQKAIEAAINQRLSNLRYHFATYLPIEYEATIKGKDIFTNTDSQIQVTIFFATITVQSTVNYRRQNSSFNFQVLTPGYQLSHEDYLAMQDLAKINLMNRYLNYASWYQSFHAPSTGESGQYSEPFFKLDNFLEALCQLACGMDTAFSATLQGLIADLSYLSSLISIGITATTVHYLDEHTFQDRSSFNVPSISSRTILIDLEYDKED